MRCPSTTANDPCQALCCIQALVSVLNKHREQPLAVLLAGLCLLHVQLDRQRQPAAWPFRPEAGQIKAAEIQDQPLQ